MKKKIAAAAAAVATVAGTIAALALSGPQTRGQCLAVELDARSCVERFPVELRPRRGWLLDGGRIPRDAGAR